MRREMRHSYTILIRKPKNKGSLEMLRPWRRAWNELKGLKMGYSEVILYER
jgi:hypothetical protein